jgi:Tfp pilus assembly protein PilV
MRGRETGSSLIEIVLATLIMGIVVVGMVSYLSGGRSRLMQEEHKRAATQLAQEAMERTVARSYPAIAAWTETRHVTGTTYTITVTVQTDTPDPGVKSIRALVTWPVGSASRNVTLDTMVYNFG